MVKPIMETRMKSNDDINQYYKFGYDTFGPLLLTYADWLKQHFQKKKYKKVFFLARDGYMMEKAYDKLDKTFTIEHEYVYFSRKSIRQALFWTCKNYEESLIYLQESRFVSAGAILEYYGFGAKEREVIAKELKFDLDEDFVYSGLKDNKKVVLWYQTLKDEIHRKSRQQYEYLLQYFEQIGMTDRCAIVDIGWHGNLQFYLEEVIRIANLQITIDGYFLGINPTRELIGEVYGYIFSQKDMSNRKRVLCFLGICERLCQSLEGTITKYECLENKVIPQLEEYEYALDANLCDRIRILHNGALSYIEQNKNKEITKKDVQHSIYRFIRFGQYPSLKQLRLFSDFYNTDGTKMYYLPQKPWYQYALRELAHGLSNSTWKTGYMKQLFKLPFPYYWIYSLVRK